MDVALPYASWDTVRMKWIPSLRRGQNYCGRCASTRRTMETRTRIRYRQVVIMLGRDEEPRKSGAAAAEPVFS